MKTIKVSLFAVIVATLAVTLPSCKAKKLAAQPAPVAETPRPTPAPVTPPPVAQAKPVDQPATIPVPPPAKPNFSFSSIQFEFDSGVLKTDAYPILDNAIMEMRKDPSAKFLLKGYASIEGSEKHNMELSQDRANSVKSYLVNGGVSAQNIIAKGYGTADPIASNESEKGKVVNRRVEIHLQ